MKKVVKKIALLLIVFGVTLIYTNNKYKVYEEEESKQIQKHVDTISMMLETEAGSGNYEMTTRDSWPTEGYIFNSTLSKCENGGELSWDDTNKKVLMIGNISDKCYVYFDKEAENIQFYLDDVLFQAKPNMTWDEWLNSNYSDGWEYKGKTMIYDNPKTIGNTGCFPFDGNSTWTSNGYFVNGGLLMIYSSSSYKTDNWDLPESGAAQIIKRKVLMKETFEQANTQVPSTYISDANDNNYYVESVRSKDC